MNYQRIANIAFAVLVFGTALAAWLPLLQYWNVTTLGGLRSFVFASMAALSVVTLLLGLPPQPLPGCQIGAALIALEHGLSQRAMLIW